MHSKFQTVHNAFFIIHNDHTVSFTNATEETDVHVIGTVWAEHSYDYVWRYNSSDSEWVSSDICVESSLIQSIHINICTYVNIIIQLVCYSTSEEHEDKEDFAVQIFCGGDHESNDDREASDGYSKIFTIKNIHH